MGTVNSVPTSYMYGKKGHGYTTVSFFRVDYPNKDDSVAGAVLFTDEWKLVELDSELKPSAVKF